jgi:hypothetical protein
VVVTAAAAPSFTEGAALRLDLANQGMRIGEDLLAAGFGMALVGEGGADAAEGVDLVLPDGWWTNVSVAAEFARTSPWTLGFAAGGGERLALKHRTRGEVAVEIPDTARFRHHRTHTGASCGDIGAMHGSWLVVAPFTARETHGLDRPRRFLGLPPARTLTKSQWSVDEVVACAEAAWSTARARLVHLEAGHVLREDGGLADLGPYVTALKRALPTLVSVSVLPPQDPAQVLALYAAGCDAISYPLLAWDESAAARVSPVRTRFVPHTRTLAALEAAAICFPRGAVSTDLLLGLEPLGNVGEACAALAAKGIVPNLTVFRPLPGAEDEAPTGEMVPTEPILRLMEKRATLMRAHRLLSSRVRGFPRVLSGMDRYRPRSGDRWYADWRRRLRVVAS